MFVNVTTKSAQHAHARMIAKTDLIHRQEMRPLRHGGSHLQNGCLHDVRDASLVCESSQFYIYIYICTSYIYKFIRARGCYTTLYHVVMSRNLFDMTRVLL